MTRPNINVIKRDSSRALLDMDKIHKIVEISMEGLSNVSVSELELSANPQFYDGITTTEIHEALIKAATNLISERSPDYSRVAANLSIFKLRKDIYGREKPWSLKEQLEYGVQNKMYTPEFLTWYSDKELAELDAHIKHQRDYTFHFPAIGQLMGKYLVQNRVTNQIFETPQFAYMLISMVGFASYGKQRIQYIKRFYDELSTYRLSLPTPIMSGVRTITKQFSSCVVTEVGDSLDSINAASATTVKYVSQRAGIGLNVGRIRALGSPIRDGEAFHTGIIPFIKHFQTAVKSCSQGGVRGGAATLYFPIWHLEIESLIVLKNNRGVEENRARHLDYAVQINRLMYQRMIEGGNITLFSPSDVPGLYDAFFEDQDKFERLYLKYEKDNTIRKKSIKAIDLFTQIAQERAQTGRIYIANADLMNEHSAFNPKVAPVRQSNLCLEIALPTKPLQFTDDPDGEISLCTLAAFNLGALKNLGELEELSDLLVRFLDEILDYQEYPMKAAERSTHRRRSLGVGAINLAYYFAKNGVKYSDGSAKMLTHETFEAIQYYLLRASNRLAKEKGVCGAFEETSYAQGLLPIDTYKKDLDQVAPFELKLDWEGLRAEIKEHGLRNSTVTALMPSETSSQISGATNGIEPPRGPITVKSSKDGLHKSVVPELLKLKDDYEYLWDIPSNKGYIELVGIMQKFVDQAISANTNYDPARFDEDKVPIKLVLQDLLYAYKMGLKTLYYHNTRDGANDDMEQENDSCGGACKL